jgi:hypothetical protein
VGPKLTLFWFLSATHVLHCQNHEAWLRATGLVMEWHNPKGQGFGKNLNCFLPPSLEEKQLGMVTPCAE